METQTAVRDGGEMSEWKNVSFSGNLLLHRYFLHILKAMETLVRRRACRRQFFKTPAELFQGLYFVNITLCTDLCVSSILINEGHCFGEELTERNARIPRTIYIK